MMLFQVPTIEMLGGENPNGWLGPWVCDTVLGLLTPFMIRMVLKEKGTFTWGYLLVFNCVGANDYANGLLAQYLDPVVSMIGMKPTPSMFVYGSVGTCMVAQLSVVTVLLRRDVVEHYLGGSKEK
eukprot:CAMPEP_0197458248 /NCGR_PEP_ID=MMETSP1175-20131217/48160_1 /TAXON_ID=1003142 /ORGANISM="Triceratium dubium, Strain CCMP147" /LENGTH=124 /DNA_ID=CAMNT_0042992835 /DNA_START=96 /DNA_END=473 /DNA_ORIENTATION=+